MFLPRNDRKLLSERGNAHLKRKACPNCYSDTPCTCPLDSPARKKPCPTSIMATDFQGRNTGFVPFQQQNLCSDLQRRKEPIFIRKVISASNSSTILRPMSIFGFGATETCSQSQLNGFSVVSYNILADSHIHKLCSENKLENSELLYLEPSFRLNSLLGELEYLDSDILCLQEVSPEWYDKLVAALQLRNYKGYYMKYLNEQYEEGEAIFYRVDKFELVKYSGVVLKNLIEKEIQECSNDPNVLAAIRNHLNHPAVALLVQLKFISNPNRLLTIVNTHISKTDMDVKVTQMTALVREVTSFANGSAYLIAGDFNIKPNSPCYQIMCAGYPNTDTIDTFQRLKTVNCGNGKLAALIDLLWKGFQHTSNCLESAYLSVTGKEAALSGSSHLNASSDGGGCLDYIWYSRDVGSDFQQAFNQQKANTNQVTSQQTMEPRQVLDLPMENFRIPNINFPSHHFSLKANFQLHAP